MVPNLRQHVEGGVSSVALELCSQSRKLVLTCVWVCTCSRNQVTFTVTCVSANDIIITSLVQSKLGSMVGRRNVVGHKKEKSFMHNSTTIRNKTRNYVQQLHVFVIQDKPKCLGVSLKPNQRCRTTGNNHTRICTLANVPSVKTILDSFSWPKGVEPHGVFGCCTSLLMQSVHFPPT